MHAPETVQLPKSVRLTITIADLHAPSETKK